MEEKKIRLLLVEDDKVDQMAFERCVKNKGLPYDYTIAGSIAEAKNILKTNIFDIIISDYMLGDGVSFELFDLFKNYPVIVTTGTGNEEIAVEAMKLGAWDYLIKDPEGHYLKTLPSTVELALKRKQNEKELKQYQENLEFMVKERTAELRTEIAERKKAEENNKKLEIQLRQAQKMESIGTLAGGIAHDFNNILYPIIGFAEMSIDDLSEDHPVRENLQDILKGAMRARDLVRQILLFSQQKELEQKPIILQPLIKETIKLLRSTISSNVKILQDLYEDSVCILGSETEFQEIIMNLCTNAYHAMEETGGTLKVCLNKVEPDPNLNLPSKEYCCLSVSDTGSGIPKKIMEKIFDPYFTTKKLGKGTGLGLSVIHGIVKNYMGKITVESDPDTGTVFKVYLPIASKTEAIEKKSEDNSNPIGDEEILFVDDEEAIVKLGVRFLKRFGYKITGKVSSVEALALFESEPDRFELVITDMAMPGITGTDLTRKLIEIRPGIPIIICSGFSDKLNDETANSLGIKAYVNKPVLLNELASKVREILDQVKKDKNTHNR